MPRPSALARIALATFALACSVVVAPVAAEAQATIVVIVRHAEKAGPSGDVALSDEGTVRASGLVAIAREAGVSGIITTQFQRTRQTAAPTALALGITGDVVAASAAVGAHAKAIADLVRDRFGGKSVLVVGHSNTVPAIVGALGGPVLQDICDAEYDGIYVMVLSPDAAPRLVRSRYGARSETAGKCGAMPR